MREQVTSASARVGGWLMVGISDVPTDDTLSLSRSSCQFAFPKLLPCGVGQHNIMERRHSDSDVGGLHGSFQADRFRAC